LAEVVEYLEKKDGDLVEEVEDMDDQEMNVDEEEIDNTQQPNATTSDQTIQKSSEPTRKNERIRNKPKNYEPSMIGQKYESAFMQGIKHIVNNKIKTTHICNKLLFKIRREEVWRQSQRRRNEGNGTTSLQKHLCASRSKWPNQTRKKQCIRIINILKKRKMGPLKAEPVLMEENRGSMKIMSREIVQVLQSAWSQFSSQQ